MTIQTPEITYAGGNNSTPSVAVMIILRSVVVTECVTDGQTQRFIVRLTPENMDLIVMPRLSEGADGLSK
ncbi:MAG: hypothetical protein LBD43_02440 [Holosporales bacterium]|jgi:hypothetical protein|nr:hypothetical protein [Holosporales bacterium]